MKQPVVVPKLTPPPPGSRGSGALPSDVVSEQAKRIVLFSGVAAFMWTFGVVMDAIVLPAIGLQPPNSAFMLQVVASVVTIAVFVYLRFQHMTAHAKCGAGL